MGQITTTEVVNGTVTDAGVINANFTAVREAINGGLDNSNVKAAANLDPAKIAPGTDTHILTTVSGQAQWAAPPAVGGTGGTTPAGALVMWATPTPPTGWLICDGSAISRATFPNLFAAIGTLYGAGDGSSTFNLPDLRGRAPYGMHASTPGVTSMGANEGQGNPALRGPHHSHSVADPGHVHSGAVRHEYGYSANYSGVPEYGPHSEDAYTTGTSYTGITVGSQGYNTPNAPAHFALHFVIKT